MSENVELRFTVDGDASGAVDALERSGSAASAAEDKFARASEGIAGGFERTGRSIEDSGDRAQRVVTGLVDTKVEGRFGAVQEKFDLLDTRAMGFRDTITGVQDSMAAWNTLTSSTEELTAKVAAAQAEYTAAVKAYGQESPQAAEAATKLGKAQEALSVQQGNMLDKLFLAGMGVGDLASGFANFIVPMAAAVTTMNAFSLATARATVASAAQRVATIATTAVTGAWTAAQWLLNAALTANPIGLVVVAIAALIAVVVLAYKRSDTFRTVVQAAMRGAVTAFNWVLGAARGLWAWIRGNWPLLLAVLTGPIGLAVRWILTRWSSLREGFASRTASLMAFVRGIPGRIRSALGNLGNLLRNAGSRVIDGFLSGIRAGFDRVRSTLGQLTSMLPDWKGPARVDREILRGSGQLVAQGFSQGFEDEFTTGTRPMMGSLTAGMADAVSVPGGAATGGMQVHVHSPAVITSDRQLVQLIDQARARVASTGVYRPRYGG